MTSMTMIHLAITLALFVGACAAIAGALIVLAVGLAALEPATIRVLHAPTRRIVRRE
jgi:hypothetical protein